MGRPANPLSNRSKILTWLKTVPDGYTNRDKRLSFSLSTGISEGYIRSIYHESRKPKSRKRTLKGRTTSPSELSPALKRLAATSTASSSAKYAKDVLDMGNRRKPWRGASRDFSSKFKLLCDFVKECGGIDNAKSVLDTLSLLTSD